MTSPTGSVPDNPYVPASRVVVKARKPSASISGTARAPAARSRPALLFDPLDPGAECPETFIDALVAAIDLPHVVDDALSLRAERGDEHRHAGADVRRLERRAAQLRRSDDNG